MITFLKENGYPITIKIDTKPIDNVNEEPNRFESFILDENNNELAKFKHKDLKARIYWANGFFCALRMQNKIETTNDNQNGNKGKI